MSPAAVYQSRLEARSQAAARHHQSSARLSAARFATGLSGVVLFWFVFVHHGASPLWMLAPVIAFAILAHLHERTIRALHRARRGVRFYQHALARLDGSWPNFGEQGNRFADPHHPYSASLDLFGPASLFQLLCSARTLAGEQALARFLLSAPPPDVTLQRQAAVADLRPRLDLREDLLLLGDDIRAGVHADALAQWGAAPPMLPSPRLRAAAFLLPFCTLAGLALWSFDGSRIFFLIAASAQAIFAFRLRPRVNQVLEALAQPARELQLVAALLRRIEQVDFQSPLLAELRGALGNGPSSQIARLARIVEFASQRGNAFFAPIAATLLWGIHFAYAIEAWRARHGSSIASWIHSLGEFETLTSLAAYAADHPADPFPELVPGPPLFDAHDLSHPLLPASRAVANSLRFDAAQPLLIISGSNMSGKSTLLRTVGVNAVLAFAGAPVRASRLALSPFTIGASIRIVDSLQEGASRFFAEITQLRLLVDLARGPVPLLFLLDEILSGTNSHDRRIGAAAILRGLLQLRATGLVTTHDLALTRIAESVQPHGLNLHFEDHLEQGRITFDYLIRPGVVAKSNALELMRSIGLDVSDTPA
jgi:hypothetical protein